MKYRVRPAKELQAKIILNNRYQISPVAAEDKRKDSWITIDVPDDAPQPRDSRRPEQAELLAVREYYRLKKNIEHYWRTGDIEIEGRIKEWEKAGYKKTDYTCRFEKGNGMLCNAPVFCDGLCFYHYNKSLPETDPQKPFPKFGNE